MFQKTILPNGLRIIAAPGTNTKAATLLVLVGVGAKYETKKENGISHFLEHMFFKGTKKRPTTLKLAETLDKVGGAYNAFTAKEYTGYWAKVRAEHFDIALDWVSDIFLNSKIEAKEITKERGVIIEEINLYLDTPTAYIEDLFEQLLYPNQPAGWKTLGEKETVARLERGQFLKYLKSHYSSLNTVVCVAGNYEPRRILDKIKNSFKKINQAPPKQKIKVVESQTKPKALVYFKATDQTHLCLGVRGYGLSQFERYGQEILTVLLGGNMSSRLFIKIREKRGLAYYIRTSAETYTDSGYLVTQAGVAHQDAKKAVGLILEEYKKMKEKKIAKPELQKAKDYIKGAMTLALESSDAQASFYAAQELLLGKITTLEEKFEIIDKISEKDIMNIAQEIFQPRNLNLALLGPHKNGKILKEGLLL